MDCKELAKDIAGDKWTLGYLKALSTEQFCTWAKIDGLEDARDAHPILDKCVDFEK